MTSTSTPTGFTIDGRPITLEQMAEALPTCVLCGSTDRLVVGVFLPHPEAEARLVERSEPHVGPVRPGKTRCAVYALCAGCASSRHAVAPVERLFLGTAEP